MGQDSNSENTGVCLYLLYCSPAGASDDLFEHSLVLSIKSTAVMMMMMVIMVMLEEWAFQPRAKERFFYLESNSLPPKPYEEGATTVLFTLLTGSFP